MFRSKKKNSEGNKNPSEETRRKISESLKNPSEETLKRMSEANKNPSEETRKRMSKSHKLTIKKIKELYQTFSSEEEMRYNPDKPVEKEIQVHCKNNKCPNSKEKDGWFTPTPQQIQNRKDQLEKKDGNDGSFFYCSQYCKDTCPCYNVYKDPLQLAKYQQYQREVQMCTNLSVKHNFDRIPNIELRGREHGYELDHKFSIMDGFNNNIDSKIIGHWRNLEVIKAIDNRIKGINSSISIEEIQKIKELSEIYLV